ncbi:MAG: beta-ribofuranosylaminobenzene 5'-phosphate synthase family protein [Gammaproteobacteria bacterium]
MIKHLSTTKVSVTAPARLHMGFLDLHGGLGRRFGSIGLYLEEIATRLSISQAGEISATGPSAERADACARELLSHLQVDGGVHIDIQQAIPDHAGLGSGTQMAMAVGTGINRLFELDLSAAELVALLDRGRRSGVGVGVFRSGGFIVDGGRGEDTIIPPVISHLPVPDTWRFLLVMDIARQGLSGHAEASAFEDLAPMDENVSGAICRQVLMQVLPALREEDCDAFGRGVTAIQALCGDYFAAVQGGHYTSPEVAGVMAMLQTAGATGTGQSSWGPTGFAVFANETEAYQALRRARGELTGNPALELKVCRARNTPAEIGVDNSVVGGKAGRR